MRTDVAAMKPAAETSGEAGARPDVLGDPQGNGSVTSGSETAVEFRIGDGSLFGILHRPARPEPMPVLMVNGGPQPRTGSHRSYVQIARYLCAQGFTVLRFDYAGLGDGQGDFVGYNKMAPSIRAALDFLLQAAPSPRGAYLWSLCDGAAASSVYAPHDARIAAMVLSNPYIFSDQVRSQTYLKHYYLQRVLEKDFWAKIVSGKLNPVTVLASFADLVRKARGGKRPAAAATSAPSANDEAGAFAKADVKDAVLGGVAGFAASGRRIHFLLSQDDLTAMGFKDLLKGTAATAAQLRSGRLTYSEIPGADHTFSIPGAKAEVCARTRAAFAAFASGNGR